jgi:Rap1a immunity proteins
MALMAPSGARGAMRLILAALLCAVGWPAAARPASAAEPPNLLRSCEAVMIGARGTQTDKIEIPHAGLHCWYYLSAVQNMSVLVDQRGQPLLGICAPANTTLLSYVRIFVEYARRHPKAEQENAAALAVTALNKAFPCGPRSFTRARPQASPGGLRKSPA